MPTPPDFTTGQVLTAAMMDQIGMWRITPTSVSGTGVSLSGAQIVLSSTTAATINGVFTSDFDNYLLIGKATSSTGDITLQFTVAGTPTTTNTYNWSMMQAYAGAGVTTVRTANTNSITLFAMGAGTTANCQITTEIMSPKLTEATLVSTQNNRSDGNYQTPANYLFYGNQADSTAFDGFKLLCAGNITGKFSVYGRTK